MNEDDRRYLGDILRCLRIYDATKALSLVEALVGELDRKTSIIEEIRKMGMICHITGNGVIDIAEKRIES